MDFDPDYQHIIDAARNRKASRLPLYEHGIDYHVMETVMGTEMIRLLSGTLDDRREFYRLHNEFYRTMGYDTISFERGSCSIVQSGYGLIGRKPGIVKSWEEFKRYPFEQAAERYFALWQEDFELFIETLPAGMKGIGGIGNGIFEVVQDFTGYTDLCLMSADDPELYAAIFEATGRMIIEIWKRFLPDYSDSFAVCRIGDDLGFKASTLLSPDDIRKHIIPFYREVVALIHSYGKPFLLHSCGRIFEVMEDFIGTVGIDAKHSNEDEIAPFTTWVERFGDRIGNFGGIDMTILCLSPPDEVERIVTSIIEQVIDRGGIAISSGNSIPNYVPLENYIAMARAVRKYRGERVPSSWPFA